MLIKARTNPSIFHFPRFATPLHAPREILSGSVLTAQEPEGSTSFSHDSLAGVQLARASLPPCRYFSAPASSLIESAGN